MKDYLGFKGKVCVVSGARTGVGNAAAEILVDLGAKVYAAGRNRGEIEGIEKFVIMDLCSKESIDKAFKEFPEKIDCFIGCAGLFGDVNDFMSVTITNFVSNKYIIQEYLSKRIVDKGTIGFVTSNNGTHWEQERFRKECQATIEAEGWEGTIQQLIDSGLSQKTGMDGYNFSKRCMNNFLTRTAHDLSKRNVRVNYVLPGPIDTKMLHACMDNAGAPVESLLDSVLENADHICAPEEVAAPLIAMCSNMMTYVTGAGIYTDFGLDSYIRLGLIEDRVAGQYEPLI